MYDFSPKAFNARTDYCPNLVWMVVLFYFIFGKLGLK